LAVLQVLQDCKIYKFYKFYKFYKNSSFKRFKILQDLQVFLAHQKMAEKPFPIEIPIELENIARGTTDPGIASITWFISPATKQANSVERKIQVKHSIGSKFGHQIAPVAFVTNFATRWRHLH